MSLNMSDNYDRSQYFLHQRLSEMKYNKMMKS